MALATTFLDALVIGAGFSGIHTLWKLRSQGFSVKVYERGSDLGGTWFFNRYPGARVDSEIPIYQLSEQQAWEDFEFGERFPTREELQRYFHHVDKKLGLSKDISYNTTVTEATFDDARNLWCVKTDTGLSTWCRHLFLCTGFASKRYTPPYKGLETFAGQWYHSAQWPEDGVDLRGKKVSVIGTGASGVQIIQEIGPVVEDLTVYQRTPNLALPMRQRLMNEDHSRHLWQFPGKERYPEIFSRLSHSFGAVMFEKDFTTNKFLETPPHERRVFYEHLWAYGGFGFWLGTFNEIFHLQEANDEVYEFWVEKTRPRIADERKRNLLAPLNPPHAWGTKRPSLEQAYFEVYNQPNVHLIDVNQTPVIKVVPEGIKTTAGVVPADVLIFATGFDSITGGILDIKLTNGKGTTIQDKWKKRTETFLGLSSAGFPNLYWIYGPQAPTAFANGPTCGGLQSDWVCDLVVNMRTQGKVRVEATKEAEDQWVDQLHTRWFKSLFPAANSWYQGANIPGKVREPLNFIEGIPAYLEHLSKCKKNGYEGFQLS